VNTSDDVLLDCDLVARNTALSLVQDVSELLGSLDAVSVACNESSLAHQDDMLLSQKSELKMSAAACGTAEFLLCDEELDDRFAEDNDESDEDDEIVEISQDENFVQRHLICREKGLFDGDDNDTLPATEGDSTNGVLLAAQKVALMQTVNRLIRAKTLVLTRRRMALPPHPELEESVLVI